MEGVYVVAVVGMPGVVVWDVPEGTKERELVLRVRDATGGTAYTESRPTVSGEDSAFEGSGEVCQCVPISPFAFFSGSSFRLP